MFGPQLSIFYLLVLIHSILKGKIRKKYIYGKIVTSLAYIFTMEKSPSQDYFFGHKFFICQSILIIFVALFRTWDAKG